MVVIISHIPISVNRYSVVRRDSTIVSEKQRPSI